MRHFVIGQHAFHVQNVEKTCREKGHSHYTTVYVSEAFRSQLQMLLSTLENFIKETFKAAIASD